MRSANSKSASVAAHSTTTVTHHSLVCAEASPRAGGPGITGARRPQTFFDTIDEAGEPSRSGSGDSPSGRLSASAAAAGDSAPRERGTSALADTQPSPDARSGGGGGGDVAELKQVLRAGLGLIRREKLDNADVTDGRLVDRPVTVRRVGDARDNVESPDAAPHTDGGSNNDGGGGAASAGPGAARAGAAESDA